MKNLLIIAVVVSLLSAMNVYAASGDAALQTTHDFLYRGMENREVNIASLETDFMPVERKLIDEDKRKDEALKANKGSSWWKWTLGALVVGGAAVAAGHKGGSSGGDNSTLTVSW